MNLGNLGDACRGDVRTVVTCAHHRNGSAAASNGFHVLRISLIWNHARCRYNAPRTMPCSASGIKELGRQGLRKWKHRSNNQNYNSQKQICQGSEYLGILISTLQTCLTARVTDFGHWPEHDENSSWIFCLCDTPVRQ